MSMLFSFYSISSASSQKPRTICLGKLVPVKWHAKAVHLLVQCAKLSIDEFSPYGGVWGLCTWDTFSPGAYQTPHQKLGLSLTDTAFILGILWF